MCGIAGFAGEFAQDILTPMAAAIAHRGPDDAGNVVCVGYGSRVGLANRRLSIQDLSAAGHQPMTLRCPLCSRVDGPEHERVWITYNGEIYNFPELRAQLEQSGHDFFSHTDTEVLLHLYASDGPDMLRRLNGIFALALYDGRTQGQQAGLRPGDVLLARDGIGVKPLYYSESHRGVLFASEMKALLECDRDVVERQLDPIAVSQYLAYQWVPAPRTVLQSVRKVLPGELLIVRRGQIASRRTFYQLPAPDTLSAKPFHAQVEEFRHRLETAVSRQMRADVPVGAFLSGGLDSSAVVAMVRQTRPSYRLPCYTMAFHDDFSSEGAEADLPYARAVARHLDLELIPVAAGPEMVDRIDEVLYALDEPTGDPAPINAYLIAEKAHHDGLKVLLSGAGGDDILGGYGRHLWLWLECVWDALPLGARRLVAAQARRVGDGPSSVLHPASFSGRRLLRLLCQLDSPRERRLMERLQSTSAGLRAKLLHESVRSRLPDDSDMDPLRDTLSKLRHDTDPLTMLLRLEQRHFLGDHNLNYLDKTTMAFSVEARVPLLDLELVEFAATIPSEYKVAGLQAKYIFKKAMEPLLPRRTIYRPKTGFGVPLRRWLTGDLRELVTDTLSARAVRERGLFDNPAVQTLLAGTRSGAIDGAYPLFSLFAFETWCRRFLDRPRGPAGTALARGAAD